MRSRAKSLCFTCAAAFLLVSASSRPAAGQDPADSEEVRLHGTTRLSPPAENPPDADAAGVAELRQHGERKAIHVHVRNLDPGATYDVSVKRTMDGNPETASLGMITTRDETPEPPAPPRCFLAFLSGAEEVPPVATSARGFALFLLNGGRTEIHYSIITNRLSGPPTAAHIHVGAPGVAGDIVITLDETDLRGTAAVTAEQVASLEAGGFYVNVHTEANPNGEIRGQIEQCQLFPPLSHAPRGPRGGNGSLRLDTEHGDMMPFNVTNLSELVGATVEVRNAAGAVVLSGTIGELRSASGHHDHQRPPAPPAGGDGGGAAAGDEEALADLAADSDDTFFEMPGQHDASFIRGDFNDDRRLTLVDPLATLDFLFQGGDAPYCLDAADANDDGIVNLTDPVLMLQSLFEAGGDLVAPYPGRGFDHTPDRLFCGSAGG